MSYNEELQSNNGELEEILRQVNALPNANPEVTAETIVSALGYTPANQEDVSTLSEQKANKQGLSLGVGEDGLVYLFVDGAAQGNGLDIKADVISGDVIGYVDNDNNIILTGALADGAYTFKYEDSEGATVDIGTLTVGGAKYTNFTDTTSTDWLTNKRLNSSGAVVDANETIVTNYIPLKVGDVVRVKGLNIFVQNKGNTGNASTHFYGSDKARVAYIIPADYNSSFDNGGYETATKDTFTYTVATNAAVVSGSLSQIAYARFVGILMDGYTANDVIITVNQEIVD